MDGIGSVLQFAATMYGEEQAKNMSAEQLRMLQKQLADIHGVQLPLLPDVKADQLGDSAVAGMQSDPGTRDKQLRALSEIQNVIDQGGLDLSDKASLEEAMSAATNQQRRARAGVAADAEARGQMNSGNRLVMDMNAAQQGANDARKNGLETAAMAQRRRLQAIQDSANMASGMREQDWREKESAARAKDIRDERNAASREKAQYYNAGLPQQNFTNAMAKATGQQPAVGAVGNALAAGAVDARQSAAGLGAVANQAVQAAGSAYPSSTGGGGSYQYTADYNGNRGGLTDLSKDDPDFK